MSATITARFSSTCPACRQPIEAGSKVRWSKGSKAVHEGCEPVAAATAPQATMGDCGCGHPFAAHVWQTLWSAGSCDQSAAFRGLGHADGFCPCEQYGDASAPPTVLISGNTYPVKSALQALGARWSPSDKGWRVPASREAEARALMAQAAPQQRARRESGSVRRGWGPCEACVFNDDAGDMNGCPRHRGNPRT